jgi:cell division septum initiation protein DivIVA
LVTAQESITESKVNSKREADLTVREAELKAEKIIEDAKLRLLEMKNELILVKAQKDSFARRLRHLLESQLDLIGVLELDDLGFESYDDSGSKYSQDKKSSVDDVEFAGVDKILPEADLQELYSSSSESRDDAMDLNLLKRQMDIDEVEGLEQKHGPASKISDKLII